VRRFEPGTLWQAIVRTSDRALAEGALLPVPTTGAVIEDQGVQFSVRVLAGLRRKKEALKEQDAAAKAGKNANPFLPPEPALTVAEITDSHLAVLNKFNVVDRHLLLVTRHFEDQDLLLTRGDLSALWLCLAEYDSLGFYNGGREAGASQQHRHLQIVPLPLIQDKGPSIPTEPVLLCAPGGPDEIVSVPGLPFLNAFVRLAPDNASLPAAVAAEHLFGLYGEMLRSVGMTTPDASRATRQSGPYCLLVTRRWMLLVPRSQEHFEDISLNSLAYAGSFFVWNEQQLARLREERPMQALRAVSLPPR
jgi:ATP adenylyltransferase